MRDFLYVNNVHGAPWDTIYEWYSPWIKHVRHRTDLSYVVDILSGEVSIGHSFVYGGDFPNVKEVPIGLLGAFPSAAGGRANAGVDRGDRGIDSGAIQTEVVRRLCLLHRCAQIVERSSSPG